MSRFRPLRWLVVIAVTVGCGACMFSTQTGVYSFVQDSAPEVTRFHFGSVMNYVSLLLRLLLAVGAIWLTRRALKSQPKAVVLALVLASGAATWFFGAGAMRVFGYQIEVSKTRLQVSIPLGAHVDAKWSDIDSLYVSGVEWREGTPLYSKHKYNEWSRMAIVVGGTRHEVDLKALTLVQRNNLLRAIQRTTGWQADLPR